MQKIDCWEICGILNSGSPHEDFYTCIPSKANHLHINGTIIDGDNEIIHLIGTIFELIETENNHIIRVDNDEKYILGDVSDRYEYELGYANGGILKELIEVCKKKGMYKCKL